VVASIRHADYVGAAPRNNRMSAMGLGRTGFARAPRCDAAAMVGDGRVGARGMRRRRCSVPHRKVQSQESTSMLDQPVSQAPDMVAARETTGRIDRSMDALQYVLAFVAIVIAVLLAGIR
jgi:hypothetical protein